MASLSSILRSTALAVITTLAASNAFATADVTSNQAAFLASLQPGYYTNDFNLILANPFAASFTFAGNGFGYTVTGAPPQGAGDDTYLSGTFVGNAYSPGALIVTFTGGVTAIGGNFFLTDVGDNFSSGPITLSLSDGTSTTIPSEVANAFTGFSGTTTITSLTMAITARGQFNSIDNLVVGRLAVPSGVVPEPATYALLAGGLMTLALARRRRQS